jgi:peptidoglycan L-alanyl-D-glutamate endopeptidase CwlK
MSGFYYGDTSEARLATCHLDLQLLARAALKTSPIDIAVLAGHRNQRDQDAAFARGTSKVQWPHGKHNRTPSEAIDLAPWPIDWNDKRRFYLLAGHIRLIAIALRIPVRGGYDWDSDGDLNDQTFDDLVHWELV